MITTVLYCQSSINCLEVTVDKYINTLNVFILCYSVI